MGLGFWEFGCCREGDICYLVRLFNALRWPFDGIQILGLTSPRIQISFQPPKPVFTVSSKIVNSNLNFGEKILKTKRNYDKWVDIFDIPNETERNRTKTFPTVVANGVGPPTR
jgi:hypothetical protein